MIRKATLDDINTIVTFNRNLASETENIELNMGKLYQGVNSILLDETKGYYFVYEIEEKVVGQIMVTKEWSDWRNGYFWWIQSVYVDKFYRRSGIFQDLYNYVKQLALKDKEVCGLRLYVEKNNIVAQSTYKKLGMEETNYLLYEWEKEKIK